MKIKFCFLIAIFELLSSGASISYGYNDFCPDGLPFSKSLTSLKQHIIEGCPYVLSYDLPPDYATATLFAHPLPINITLNLLRFIAVDDLGESLSLFLNIYLEWPMPCRFDCDAFFGNASFLCNDSRRDMFHFFMKPEDVWTPKLTHQNALSQARPVMALSRDVWIEARPLITANWAATGRIDLACSSFTFVKFPFDALHCSFILESEAVAKEVNYSIVRFVIDESAPPGLLSETDVWELDNRPLESHVSIINKYGSVKYFHRLNFTINMRRKPVYYLSHIFVALYGLFALLIASLLIEPGKIERPGFSMTVVLAYAFVLSIVYQILPQTSETVYLVILVSAKFGFGVLLTFHSLIFHALKTKKAFKSNNIFTLRRLDLCIGLLLTGIALTIDIVLFSLMAA